MRRSIHSVGANPFVESLEVAVDALSATALTLGLPTLVDRSPRRWQALLAQLARPEAAEWFERNWNADRGVLTFGAAQESDRGRYGNLVQETFCGVTINGTRCPRPAQTLAPGTEIRVCALHQSGWRHHAQRRRSWQQYLEIATIPPKPGKCAVHACERTAKGGSEVEPLCPPHASRPSRRLRSFEEFCRSEPPAGLRHNEIYLGALATIVRAEVLLCCFLSRSNMVDAATIQRLVQEAAVTDVQTLGDLKPIKPTNATRHQAWLNLLERHLNDPTEEWDRPSVRLGVIDPDKRHTVLHFHKIEQRWLEDLTRRLIHAVFNDVEATTLGTYVRAVTRLSKTLATRSDGGHDYKVLGTQDITRLRESLEAGGDLKPYAIKQEMFVLRAVLSKVRILELLPDLPSNFAVQPRHIPQARAESPEETALPNATMGLLLGYDGRLGTRTLDLMRAIPAKEGPIADHVGEMAVVIMRTGANFGRRPEELLQSQADCIVTDDAGRVFLRYDNLKSGRDGVLLPVHPDDARGLVSWQQIVRSAFPDVPWNLLTSFPAPNANSGGTASVVNSTFARWFRIYVMRLEQAIILAKLSAETGLSVARLCRATPSDLHDGALHIDGVKETLSRDAYLGLVDYHARLSAYGRGRGKGRGAASWLFPNPGTRNHAATAAQSADPGHFEPLGPDWASLAAGYPTWGLPGAGGTQLIDQSAVQFRRFRHTYLQHLWDIGTDILVIKELADHSNINTTFSAYVRPRYERKAQAIRDLHEYRIDAFRQPALEQPGLRIGRQEVVTNDCSNVNVTRHTKEGCDFGELCFRCPHSTYDPSHLPELRTKVHMLRKAVMRFELEKDEHRLVVAREDHDGHLKILNELERQVAALPPEIALKVEDAAQVIIACRNHARGGSLGDRESHPAGGEPRDA